jgi:hypothetical protein
MRKANPRFAAEQDQFILDYKRRMEENRKLRQKMANKTSETKYSEEPNPKVELREFVTDKETLDRWNREDERKKMLAEKHRKDIEDMMKKKPLE